MNKKTKRKKLRRVLSVIGIILAVLLIYVGFLARSDWNLTRGPDLSLDFTSIIRDNVSLDARVIDIAMLGAHNTLSHYITSRSPIDPNEDSAPAQHPILLTIAPGTFARFGRTQLSDLYGLLQRGVRYVDARITYDGQWYAENTLLSDYLRNYLTQLIRFLQENPGELVIFAINDARFGGAVSYSDLFNYMGSVQYNGQSIFDFVHHDPFTTPIHELLLRDATQNGQTGGVVILAQAAAFPGGVHYYSRTDQRRIHHAQQQTSVIIEYINEEHLFLLNGQHNNMLRVSQSQLGPVLWGAGLVDSLLRWSYIRINATHNRNIIDYDGLPDWLETTPILQFGVADSSVGNFNQRIIEIINEFNRSRR